MWIEGTTHDGKYIRRSLKTSSWEKAAKQQKEIEDEGAAALNTFTRTTTKEAIDEFLKDLRQRGVTESSMRQFNAIYKAQFLAWCTAENYKFIHEIDIAALRAFRETWGEHAARTKHTKQIRLKQFFKFCIRNKWLKENPVESLSRIKLEHRTTGYFAPDEMEKLLRAALAFDPLNQHRGGKRLHALVLLMRWSGLRITDAVTLERSRIVNGELLAHQKKTGRPVWVPLPGIVTKALQEMPDGLNPNERYFFWSGNGNPNNAADVAHKAFRKVAAKALPEKRCHPHMLRDTFAVEMLLAGVSLDQVSMLLGHASVTMTERHYAPWVKARQDQLAANVRKAWASSLPASGDERGS